MRSGLIRSSRCASVNSSLGCGGTHGFQPSEWATKANDYAIQIHGGYGYTREFPVERYLRDAKLCEIGEGTSEIQRTIISREVFKQA